VEKREADRFAVKHEMVALILPRLRARVEKRRRDGIGGRIGRLVAMPVARNPATLPHIFVSVASKELRVPVSGLESTLADTSISVDSKGVGVSYGCSPKVDLITEEKSGPCELVCPLGDHRAVPQRWPRNRNAPARPGRSGQQRYCTMRVMPVKGKN
jgi:hypothetical protein